MSGTLPSVELWTFFLMFIFAFGIEKHYTSRLNLLANAGVFIIAFGWSIFTFGGLFGAWSILLIVAGILSTFTYLYGFSIGPFHEVFYLVFGSKTVLGVLIAIQLNNLQLIIPLVIIIWVICYVFLGHELPFSN